MTRWVVVGHSQAVTMTPGAVALTFRRVRWSVSSSCSSNRGNMRSTRPNYRISFWKENQHFAGVVPSVYVTTNVDTNAACAQKEIYLKLCNSESHEPINLGFKGKRLKLVQSYRYSYFWSKCLQGNDCGEFPFITFVLRPVFQGHFRIL